MPNVHEAVAHHLGFLLWQHVYYLTDAPAGLDCLQCTHLTDFDEPAVLICAREGTRTRCPSAGARAKADSQPDRRTSNKRVNFPVYACHVRHPMHCHRRSLCGLSFVAVHHGG